MIKKDQKYDPRRLRDVIRWRVIYKDCFGRRHSRSFSNEAKAKLFVATGLDAEKRRWASVGGAP